MKRLTKMSSSVFGNNSQITFIFCFISCFKSSLAFPNAAGSCDSGTAAMKTPHASEGLGDLIRGGYQVLINNDTLSASTVYSLHPSSLYMLQLTTGNELGHKSFFRGFLFRLSGDSQSNNINNINNNIEDEKDDVDASMALDIQSENTLVQILPICSPNISGLCHVSNEPKTNVSALLEYPFEGDLRLEVTVVYENKSGKRDQWYYSSFDLRFEDSENEIDDISKEEENKIDEQSENILIYMGEETEDEEGNINILKTISHDNKGNDKIILPTPTDNRNTPRKQRRHSKGKTQIGNNRMGDNSGKAKKTKNKMKRNRARKHRKRLKE